MTRAIGDALGQGSLLFLSLSLFSFSAFLSVFFSLDLLLSSSHPRADVTKFAAADALYSGLLLENREEELLLLRGESIPRSLWWSKGRTAGTKGRMGKWRKRWWLGMGCEGWMANGTLGYCRWFLRRGWGVDASETKRAKGVLYAPPRRRWGLLSG